LLSAELFHAALARGVDEPAGVSDWRRDIEQLDFSRW
jgi:hypothetical protein